MKFPRILLCIVVLIISGCKEDYFPKPKALLRLDFPQPEYQSWAEDCPFRFDQNQWSILKDKSQDCALVLDYPEMKGSIYLTYKPVKNNLRELLTDAQKLSYEHAVKADAINAKEYVNLNANVYGSFYEVTGNAASQSQFYVTDSSNHFLTGSLYFYAKPNYDSILPAAAYLQNDIRRIMESLRWANQ